MNLTRLPRLPASKCANAITGNTAPAMLLSCRQTFYGPNDNYDLNNRYVLPSLIYKTHEAKLRGDHDLTVWGTETPLRKFLYVDDMADICIFEMDAINFQRQIVFDTSKPDGTPRKLLAVSKMEDLGRKSQIDLRVDIKNTYQDFLNNRV